MDSYSYHGLWLDAMVSVDADGKMINIRRSEKPDSGVSLGNIFNQCSSRDAMDADLYEFDNEDRLVYYKETAERKIVDGKPELFSYKIRLTFNKKSESLKDIVIAKLNEEGRDIVSIDTEVVETFAVPGDEVVHTIKEWTGMDFNLETKEWTYTEPTEMLEGDTFCYHSGMHRDMSWSILGTYFNSQDGEVSTIEYAPQGALDGDDDIYHALGVMIEDILFREVRDELTKEKITMLVNKEIDYLLDKDMVEEICTMHRVGSKSRPKPEGVPDGEIPF